MLFINKLKVPLLRGGAADRVVAGVCYQAGWLNTPLHPSQEGNRTTRAFLTRYSSQSIILMLYNVL